MYVCTYVYGKRQDIHLSIQQYNAIHWYSTCTLLHSQNNNYHHELVLSIIDV